MLPTVKKLPVAEPAALMVECRVEHDDLRFNAFVAPCVRFAQGAYAACAAAEEGGEGAELGIVLGSDDAVKELNRQFRGKDAPTNVLSFPSGEEGYLGDIFISLDTICREAHGQGKNELHHLGHMAVHGVLHLLGYDHETDGEAEVMEALEASILAGFGIADPYL